MADNIIIEKGLTISTPNTPTREGERISTLEEMANIPTPSVGMVVYVESLDQHFYVKSVKPKVVGGVLVQNGQVNEYAPLGGKANVIWNDI